MVYERMVDIRNEPLQQIFDDASRVKDDPILSKVTLSIFADGGHFEHL